MFAFLASVHRVPPQLEEGSEEQENAEQTRDGLLTVKYVCSEYNKPQNVNVAYIFLGSEIP